jgi:hypothetical protein
MWRAACDVHAHRTGCSRSRSPTEPLRSVCADGAPRQLDPRSSHRNLPHHDSSGQIEYDNGVSPGENEVVCAVRITVEDPTASRNSSLDHPERRRHALWAERVALDVREACSSGQPTCERRFPTPRTSDHEDPFHAVIIAEGANGRPPDAGRSSKATVGSLILVAREPFGLPGSRSHRGGRASRRKNDDRGARGPGLSLVVRGRRWISLSSNGEKKLSATALA